uniref:S-layer protein domain-containing protein n=1 Tax=Methanosarcina horonobensis TaxID=418008 RepID=UPI00373FDE3C
MRNRDSFTLGRGDTVNIMGKLSFVVADASELRFAPIVETTEPGTYELRGTVHDETFNTTVWTPYNFEGFYYNIDENVSTESLTITEGISGRTIGDEKLVYSTSPALVSFERESWGSYEVIGFMAEKYFAGYPANTFGNSRSVSILSDDILSKVLIDDDNRRSIFTGSSIALENGYSLKAAEVDVNGNSVLLELYKDGRLVDSGIVSSNRDYVYEADIGGAEDIPMIAVHISTVFRSRETDAVFIEGIFQISDEYLELSQGDSFGKMEISSISDSGIIMRNEDSISLSRGNTVNLMGNVKFKVLIRLSCAFIPLLKLKVLHRISWNLKLQMSSWSDRQQKSWLRQEMLQSVTSKSCLETEVSEPQAMMGFSHTLQVRKADLPFLRTRRVTTPEVRQWMSSQQVFSSCWSQFLLKTSEKATRSL